MVGVIIHDGDEDGNILDGHTRSAIAAELGIDCPRVVRSGLAEYDKYILAVELNAARRQLTDAQMSIAGQRLEPHIAERAKARQLAALRVGHDTPCRTCGELFAEPVWHCDACDHHWSLDDDECGNCHQAMPPTPLGTTVPNGKTVDEVARMVGLGSGRTFLRHVAVVEQIEAEPDGPQLIADMERGDLTIREAPPGA